jgi:hypothetical protein
VFESQTGAGDVLFSFTGLKRPGREINHSPLSTAEVKNEWSHTSVSFL